MQTFSAYEYILADIASQFGHDKVNWEQRIQWTLDNINCLEEGIDIASKPYLYIKAINALKTVRADKPTNHLIGLDASASGIGIMGLLCNDPKTLFQTNLLGSEDIQDVYSNLNIEMNKHLESELKVERKKSKNALMTVGYGSRATPKKIFGDGSKALEQFYKAREFLIPGTIEVSSVIQDSWNPNAPDYLWELPDGHTAKCLVKDQEPTQLRIMDIHGIKGSFTYQYTKVGVLSDYSIPIIANVVQSIDAYICRQMIMRCWKQGFHILTVHDSFWCHPNNVNKMRQTYNQICAEISKSTMLNDILTQLYGLDIEYEKWNKSYYDEIMQANYAIS